MKFFVRAVSTDSLQKFTTAAGIASVPASAAAGKFLCFFLADLQIGTQAFCVAFTNARTEPLSGASFNLEKSAAVGAAGRSA